MFKAIWLDKDNEVRTRIYAAKWKPSPGEILVEVQYSGINPADIKHGFIGFHESVAGYDYAGIVIEVGEDRNEEFKIGDKVCGFGAPMRKKPPQYGTHQHFHVASSLIFKVPSDVPIQDASTLPVVTHTAADALFNQLGLELGSEEKNPILIWGGAGAVGVAAIQLAKAAGCYPIVTVASEKNHAILLSIGADKCFDYHIKDVEQQISRYMNGENFTYIFDAVVAAGNQHSASSTKICEGLATTSAKCVATLPTIEPKREWQAAFACRSVDIVVVSPQGHEVVFFANSSWQEKMNEAFEWALQNYGNKFVMPNVKVIKGEQDALDAIRCAAAGKASLEKFTIQHPL